MDTVDVRHIERFLTETHQCVGFIKLARQQFDFSAGPIPIGVKVRRLEVSVYIHA